MNINININISPVLYQHYYMNIHHVNLDISNIKSNSYHHMPIFYYVCHLIRDPLHHHWLWLKYYQLQLQKKLKFVNSKSPHQQPSPSSLRTVCRPRLVQSTPNLTLSKYFCNWFCQDLVFNKGQHFEAYFFVFDTFVIFVIIDTFLISLLLDFCHLCDMLHLRLARHPVSIDIIQPGKWRYAILLIRYPWKI